jgi:predicted dinucleotide-binding enzyme
MRVGVIGSGRIGGNAGMQLARAGHEIMFSFTRDRAALDEFAAGVQGASAGSPSEAAEFADAVFLAVPWSLVERAVEEAGGLARKTVIDTTNQYGGGGLESLPAETPGLMALPTGIGDALTEALFARTPQLRCVSYAGGYEAELREHPGLARRIRS